MTVRRRELFTVTAPDDDPKAMIEALLELPPDVQLVDVDHDERAQNWMGHQFGTSPVTFTFQRKPARE